MYVYVRSLAQTLLMTGALAGMALAATTLPAQDEAPPRNARLAHLQGNVSVQPNGVDDWGAAAENMPMGAGDRVYSDQQAQGELQAGQVRAYFAPSSDLTLVNANEQGIEMGLAQGSAHVYSDGFGQDQSLYISTPNGGVTVAGRADFRLDVFPDDQSTVITNFQGSELVLNGAGDFSMQLEPGQSIQLSGTNPVYTQALAMPSQDNFWQWSASLESRRANSASARYVSTDMAGYDELDGNGDWQPDSDYGPVWFPRVDAGWAPYHNGHWVNRPFYGWTWVEDEPWGAAPFHYGRWVQMRGRWGWIPGPREVHPVWSPAQVVFAGGVQFGGIGLSVWFPLGPGEPYHPWYPASSDYVNRINRTNIRESRVVHVQNTYITNVNVTNITYVNRTVGATAMRPEDFSAGRSARTVAVRVDPRAIEHVQPIRPNAPVPVHTVIVRPVARPVAIATPARPVLINHQGQQVIAAPNARPVAVPVRTAPPVVRPIPGRTAIGVPAVGRPMQPNQNGNQRPNQLPANSNQHVGPVQGVQPNAPRQPNQPPMVTPTPPVRTVEPAAPVQPLRPAPVGPARTVEPPVQPARPSPAAPVPPARTPVQPGAPNQPVQPVRPAPTAPVPPAAAQPVRPAQPAPVERPVTPPARQDLQPIRPTPTAPQPPARPQTPPAVRPQPVVPEAKPVPPPPTRPNQAPPAARPAPQQRPVPPAKENKKPEKKEEK